jgi:rfaE bifunctional protein kinase chain/domain
MDTKRLTELLDGFTRASIAIIGDFFLDKYLIIDPALDEPSLETGLTAYQIVDKRPSPGAAGTVSSNLAALRVGRLVALGAVGDDGEGYELRQGLRARGIEDDHLLVRGDLFTPTYTKPMVIDPRAPGGEREINRLDVKWRTETPHDVETEVLAQLDALLPDLDAVVIADQVQERNHGVITDRVRAGLAERARAHPGVVFFADSRSHITEFRHIIIKPNAAEAARAAGADEELASPRDAMPHARRMMELTGRPVFVTLGPNGMLVAEESGCEHVPGVAVEGEIDIVGAGDSAVAGAVSALCAGADCVEAALVGNLVASITIQQLGTTGIATPAQVLARFAEAFPSGAAGV